MIKYLIIIAFFFYSCQNKAQTESPLTMEALEMSVGAENFEDYIPLLQGKRVGFVGNHSSLVDGDHLVDKLVGMDIKVAKIFGPEHGFRGNADAGEKIKDGKDVRTGIPIISLYGKNKKPSPESLSGLDIVVFDIQDVGVRFYTYISTLHYVMESCAENGIPVIVLDRPNPHAHYVDGPVMEEEFVSFVGMHKVPVVYGMTIGEYALMINGEKWLDGNVACELTVISCKNYKRNKLYSLPVKPSPNLPNDLAIQLYPSLCLFEGTSFSAGRGTEFPFQQYGHPRYTGSKTTATPRSMDGAKYPKFENEPCYWNDLSTTQPMTIFQDPQFNIGYLIDAFQNFEASEEEFFLENNFFEKLAGNAELRQQILNEDSETEIRKSWQTDLKAFIVVREKYLLY